MEKFLVISHVRPSRKSYSIVNLETLEKMVSIVRGGKEELNAFITSELNELEFLVYAKLAFTICKIDYTE